MTLADKYMHILQSITQSTYQQLQPSTENNPILIQLLSQSLDQKQSSSLQDLFIINRQLKQEQIEYLLSIVESQEYLKVISCLSKGQFKSVRKNIENLFFNNKISSPKILVTLLAQYYVHDGLIQKSEQMWKLINEQISSQLVIPLLQKLSTGKTPQKIELSKILKYLNSLRGDYYQPLSKIELEKILQIKHSRLNKNKLIIGIIDIIIELSNKRIKQKVSNKILQQIIDHEQWIQVLSVRQIMQLMQIVTVSQNVENGQINTIQRIINKIVSIGKTTIEQNFKILTSNQSFIIALLNVYKSNPKSLSIESLIDLQKEILNNSSLSKLFLQAVSPHLFSSFNQSESVFLINRIPKQLIQFLSKLITIKQQTIQKYPKLANNQSLYCLYYLYNIQYYGHLINQQIRQFRKQSYVNHSDIVELINHINYMLEYSNIQVDFCVLFLIQQLFQNKIFAVDTRSIYSNISLQVDGEEALKRHFQNLFRLQNYRQEISAQMISILINCKSIESALVQTFIQNINSSNLSEQELVSIYSIHVNYSLPHSKYLYQESLFKLKQSNILTCLIEKYSIKYQLSNNYLSTLNPSPKFIQYLLKANPTLLNQLSKYNWQFYKQQIKNGFFELYEKALLPRVYPINFRGSLFNDMPLVFQYLTPHTEQLYFSNYSGYMSLLYLQISCSNPKINKKQILKYLFNNVVQTNKCKTQLNTQYYTNLIWWKMFVLACYKLLDSQSKEEIGYIVNFLLKDIENKTMPILRQNMELLFYRLLCLQPELVYLLIDKLKDQNAVNVNAPVILSLGLYMLDNKSEEIFEVLVTYISSHTAYVRALAQYYCFQYLKLYGNERLQKQQFLKNIVLYIEQSKQSKKLMRNIKNGVQLFDSLVKNMNIKTLFTINFQKCEDNVISQESFNQLQAEGRKYLVSIYKYINTDLRPIVMQRIRQMECYQFYSEPSFQSYLSLHHRQQELIIVATLLEKPPNFGHLVRTCSQYSNITLCFPTRNILNQPDYKQLIPEQFKCSIIQLKQKDLTKYLTVQKQRDYKLIALEQTSNSVTIDKFEFPRRAVIVLGNERIGMGSSVIDMMDHLVEIQQFGKVRSLNVHVSSVILLWNYTKGKMN